MNLVALALRLAVNADAAGRRRSIMVTFATAIGTAVALIATSFAHADRVANPERYADGGLGRLSAVAMAVVGLQVVALAASAGRLSAVVRAKRLSNLRMLGLTAARTRFVSAIEVGVFACIGAALGVVLFAASQPLLTRVSVAGQRWPSNELRPGALTGLIVVVGTVVLTTALAVLPDRLNQSAAMARVRRVSTKAPSMWRLVPLLIGVGLCVYVKRTASDGLPIKTFLAALATLGIGVMVVMPVFARLVAAVLDRTAQGPVLLVATRRLQSQSAGVSRVVTGLLIGLFAVTGARYVVTAFESTPQYRNASIGVLDHQSVVLTSNAARIDSLARSDPPVTGVRSVTAVAHLEATGCETGPPCPSAIVADCSQIKAIFPSAAGCEPDQAQWIRSPDQPPPDTEPGNPWHLHAAAGPAVAVTAPQSTVKIDSYEPFSCGYCIRIPPTLPGVAELKPMASHTAYVVGEPGRDMPNKLEAAGFQGAFAPWDPSDYDIVATLKLLSNALAALVLGLGLLAFAIAAIDRAADRRREVMSLLLLGSPRSLLRRSQWIEAAIPILGGGVLAILLGLLAGSAYLAGIPELEPPTAPIGWLVGAATIGGIAVASLTVIAASPTIDTHNIRRE
ncbi:MAG TPA: FtsX-like permease family protein [Microthrixaceae bacterium]|nr:FtsX-like permease family protein [Microthrixaceae bacterium]